jgi:WD40 repeat protein
VASLRRFLVLGLLCALLGAGTVVILRAAPVPEDKPPAEESKPLLTIKGFGNFVKCVAFSPDGRRLVTVQEGGKDVTVWDAGGGKELLSIPTEVNAVAYSPDGKKLVLATFRGGQLYDAATGDPLPSAINPDERNDNAYSIAFSPDGKSYAIAGNYFEGQEKNVRQRGVFTIYDANTGKEVRRVPELNLGGPIRSLSFSTDGKQLLTASAAKEIYIWDVSLGKQIHELQARVKTVGAAAFSPDGRWIAVGYLTITPGIPADIQVWDAKTYKELRGLPQDSEGISCLVFSPNGKYVACGGRGEARVWGVKSGKLLVKFTGHVGTVRSLAFSPDGRRLAAGSGLGGSKATGEVKVWDVSKYTRE